MIFYALYSESLGRYNTPFLAHDDDEAVAIVSKTLVSHQDQALIMSLDDLSLCKVGIFDSALNHPVEALFDVEIILDHLERDLPLPPLLRKQVDQLYKKDGGANAE